MHIQVSSNHGPRGSGGITIGKTIFTCVYIETNLLQNQQTYFNEILYRSSLGKGNNKMFNLRARSSSKGR
jgi:hypothetical protein